MQKLLPNYLFYLIGALILIIDAIYNGYPIIYHDLSTYVANGFDLETPIDRPITYCLFLRLFSLNGFTLWTVILAQAYILSYLMFKLMQTIFGKGMNQWLIIGSIAFLSLFTGLSWTASQVLPDIFTSISVIIVTILFIGNLKRNEQFLLYFLFLVSTAMHLSHISFNVALILVLLIVKLIKIKRINTYLSYQMLLILFGITVVAFTTMLSASAKSKHIFFMGAMVEHGIAKAFLDNQCETKQYHLCTYRNELPVRAYQFVWDEDSPLYKMGGWKAVKEEFDAIIFETLTTPKYIGLHIKASLLATADQLLTFKINDGNGVMLEGTLPYDRMERYLPYDLKMYRASKQMNDEFGFTNGLNHMYTMLIILSLLVLVFLLVNGKIFRGDFAFVLFMNIIGIILNAWVSGTFANAIDRLGCKMIWLIPFAAIIGSIQFYSIKENKTINEA